MYPQGEIGVITSHPMASTLGEKLKHLRVENGDMTAVALARIAGVSKQTMSLWLKGERRPSIDEGLRMARYFGVPLDWLADEEANYPPPPPRILRTRVPAEGGSGRESDQKRDSIPEIDPPKTRRLR